MCYSKIFKTTGDRSEDESTLFSLSTEFLEAAITLQNTPPTKINYRSVSYYLLGHAAELSLKSFLFQQGLSSDDLKTIGHDLKRLIRKSKEKNISKNASFEQLNKLAKLYKRKELEYRTKSLKSFPNIEDLIAETKQLQAIVFDSICQC
tara:strand:- start:33 stop:479 length:447 start_codon:yes stop_codon:yes gene_type:complete